MSRSRRNHVRGLEREGRLTLGLGIECLVLNFIGRKLQLPMGGRKSSSLGSVKIWCLVNIQRSLAQSSQFTNLKLT